MQAAETYVAAGSRLFYHVPGQLARDLFLYPTIIGDYHYLPGYSLTRQRFHNYLLMYVEDGEMALATGGKKVETAQKNSYLLLDCRLPHRYTTTIGAHVLWMHFDGRLAGAYYEHITDHGERHLLHADVSAEEKSRPSALLRNCYESFARELVPEEEWLSDSITEILRSLLVSGGLSAKGHGRSDPDSRHSQETVMSSISGVRISAAYISAHFNEALPLEELADMASLSPYYFIRQFRAETGMTPHQYLIKVRMDAAKYLLQTTVQPVAAIAQQCGFQDAGTFCAQFRRQTGVTPRAYRQNAQAPQ